MGEAREEGRIVGEDRKGMQEINPSIRFPRSHLLLRQGSTRDGKLVGNSTTVVESVEIREVHF